MPCKAKSRYIRFSQFTYVLQVPITRTSSISTTYLEQKLPTTSWKKLFSFSARWEKDESSSFQLPAHSSAHLAHFTYLPIHEYSSCGELVVVSFGGSSMHDASGHARVSMQLSSEREGRSSGGSPSERLIAGNQRSKPLCSSLLSFFPLLGPYMQLDFPISHTSRWGCSILNIQYSILIFGSPQYWRIVNLVNVASIACVSIDDVASGGASQIPIISTVANQLVPPKQNGRISPASNQSINQPCSILAVVTIIAI